MDTQQKAMQNYVNNKNHFRAAYEKNCESRLNFGLHVYTN